MKEERPLRESAKVAKKGRIIGLKSRLKIPFAFFARFARDAFVSAFWFRLVQVSFKLQA
jgi:hypothetical protein